MFGIRSFVVLFGCVVAGLMAVFVMEKPASSATLPDGFAEERVVGGLASPTAMAFLPDGGILVAEQRGKLRVFEEGSLSTGLDLSRIVDDRGERGLLGVALDPAFAQNGHVYVYFTRKSAGKNPPTTASCASRSPKTESSAAAGVSSSASTTSRRP